MSSHMPSWRDVDAAKAAGSEAPEAIARAPGLPPGYISGCSLSVTATNTIQIGVGIVEVVSASVRITAARSPDSDNWEVLRLNGDTYYVYIDKGANLHIDTLDPDFRIDLMGEYHRTHAWRYLGQFYIGSEGVLGLALNRGERKPGAHVLVAASDYSGDAGYHCFGSNDQIEINAAASYMAAIGGGVVELTEETFSTTGSVSLPGNIVLMGQGAKTIIEKNCNDYAIKAVGSSGSELNHIYIRDIKFTRASADTNNKALAYFTYVDNLKITTCVFDSSYYESLYLDHCDNFFVGDNVFLNISYKGIYSYSSTGNIRGNDFSGLLSGYTGTSSVIEVIIASKVNITGNIIHDISVNSDPFTAIMVQTAGISATGIIAENQISDIANSGGDIFGIAALSAHKIIITNNKGVNVETTNGGSWSIGILLTDADYVLVCENHVDNCTADTAAQGVGMYLNSVSGNTDNCNVNGNHIVDCSGIGIYIDTDSARNLIAGNYCYNNGSDSGIANANEHNFDDDGTDTHQSGNSWQQPVASESSRGTPHKHYNKLLDGVDPNTSVTEVDCSGQVPVGSRMVLLHIDASSTGVSYEVAFYDDSGAAASAKWGHAQTGSAAAHWHGQLIVGLDAARKFYYQAAHANVDDLTVEMLAYWL